MNQAQTIPPLVFQPRYVEKIWGGRRLEATLKKKLPPEVAIGESWEIYDFPPGYVDGSKEWLTATVASGDFKGRTLHELVVDHTEALLGNKKPFQTPDGPQFPLLIKFLDATDDLSIQVHPTPTYAAKHPEAHLKTECWIVMDATPGAFLYKGLKPGTTLEDFDQGLKNGAVAGLIEQVPAEKGECHFLPSGVVHALGAGTLVAEVQTPSDTTFRVWDFNRIEVSTGKPRKMHVDEALACIEFDGKAPPPITKTQNDKIPLVDCEFFKTQTVKAFAHTIKALPKGEMKVWLILDGMIKLRWGAGPGGQLSVRGGQTLLLPAALPPNVMATFPVNTTYLETTLP